MKSKDLGSRLRVVQTSFPTSSARFEAETTSPMAYVASCNDRRLDLYLALEPPGHPLTSVLEAVLNPKRKSPATAICSKHVNTEQHAMAVSRESHWRTSL